MARNETNRPYFPISAAIGLAVPMDNNQCGYLSEYCSHGETASKAGEYAEDLAETMLAMKIDADSNQNTLCATEKKSSSGIKFKTHFCQSAEGNKDGLWTTVVVAAVFIL
jgi:arginine decarboxylase